MAEEGDAPADADGYTFRYAATARNTTFAGSKIIVSAYDNPGNETTQQKTL